MSRTQSTLIKIVIIVLSVFSLIGLFGGMISLSTAYFHTRRATQRQDVLPYFVSNHRVLYISSYEEGYSDPVVQERGIRNAFTDCDITLDVLHISVSSQQQTGDIMSLTPYDAVLVGDDASMKFVERYRDTLYQNIPIVFFNISDSDYGYRIAKDPYITGTITPGYLENLIETALTLMPKATKILGIYNNTLSGLICRKYFEILKKKYTDYQFSGINTSILKQDLLETTLKNLDSDTIVLYVSFTNVTADEAYLVTQNAQFVVSHCNVPVFTNIVGVIGRGLVGGYVVDREAAGRHAAELVLSIFSGKPISSILATQDEQPHVIFDFEVLKKYGLDASLLPEGTQLINNRYLFFVLYKDILIPVAIIFLSLLFLMLVLVIQRIQAVHYANALDVSHSRLKYQALHDSLTKLPNRSSERIDLQSIIDSQTAFALLKIHIIGFKHLNDSYTHACGDVALKAMAARLFALQQTGHFFASRVSGADFSLHYYGGCLYPTDEIFKKIEDLQEISFQYKSLRLSFKVAIGIVNVSQDSFVNIDELMTDVCLALDEARRHSIHTISFFDSSMRERLLMTNTITSVLEEACLTDGFTIVYQPQINASSCEVVGYEALVRLKNGLYRPDQFIPVAEESSLIIQIGRIITEKVIFQLALWREHGMQLHTVAINFSAGQLDDAGYSDFLNATLHKYDISPSLVEIEITESLYLGKSELATNLFNNLAALGVNLALDDFGTGYSSISYLSYLPVKKVKIDKTMTDTYLQEGKDSLIKNIITMVHDLGMKLTVEGVEQKDQFAKLQAFNCDIIQGYLFSKPIDGQSIESWHVPDINHS